MKRLIPLLIAVILFVPPLQSLFNLSSAGVAASIPTFSIVSVVRDQTVTIRTSNFPSEQVFKVRMGKMGTLGIGGLVVEETSSGSGGSFLVTYNIPEALHGRNQISIRMDSSQGYYAYNWFYNNTTGGEAAPPPPAEPTPVVPPPAAAPYRGIPTFTIVSVVRNETVSIRTSNFPANQTFTVTMGLMGTRGVRGVVVASTPSEAGGVFEITYTIPETLHDRSRIAIRLQSPQGYYAYNWFYNNTTGAAASSPAAPQAQVPQPTPTQAPAAAAPPPASPTQPPPAVPPTQPPTPAPTQAPVTAAEPTPAPETPAAEPPAEEPPAVTAEEPAAAEPTVAAQVEVPAISIISVAHGESVAVRVYNFPPNQVLTVTMGEMGSRGVGGIVVGSTSTGQGGAFDAIYDIPTSLRSAPLVAIRLESPEGYYAFSWFHNRTLPQ
jgi:hypothetical protein